MISNALNWLIVALRALAKEFPKKAELLNKADWDICGAKNLNVVFDAIDTICPAVNTMAKISQTARRLKSRLTNVDRNARRVWLNAAAEEYLSWWYALRIDDVRGTSYVASAAEEIANAYSQWINDGIEPWDASGCGTRDWHDNQLTLWELATSSETDRAKARQRRAERLERIKQSDDFKNLKARMKAVLPSNKEPHNQPDSVAAPIQSVEKRLEEMGYNHIVV